MAGPKIKVFEDAKFMDEFDLVCPSCANIIAQPYNGRTGRLNVKCDSCNTWLYEYSGIAVEHGKASKVKPRDMERTLRDYWELEIHGDTKKKDFKRAAEEIGVYDYL